MTGERLGERPDERPDERHSIARIEITPVAFVDPPLLNAVGVHQPFALRAIVEVVTDSGVTGLGETYGDEAHLARLYRAVAALIGTDIFNINDLAHRVARALSLDHGPALRHPLPRRHRVQATLRSELHRENTTLVR